MGLVLAACLLGSCGVTDSIDDAPRSSAAAESLPRVDLSQPPEADDPDPSVRAGAAADFIQCEYGIAQGGWSMDFGPLGSGPDPGGALRNMITEEVLGMPGDGFTAAGRDEHRVLFVHEVGDRATMAVIVADSAHVKLDADDRWAVETFASCDPAEFDPSTDDRFPMDIWQDVDGDRVPTSIITSFAGAEHCGWESATFLTVDGETYISDPEGVLDGAGLAASFSIDARLPADAIDTGYQHDGRRLWRSADHKVAFIVTADRTESWPPSTEQFACA